MLSNFAVLVIVGIIWGLTNYLIEMNYKEDIPLKDNETQNMMTKAMMYIKNNYISFILFICNQSGSILFYFSLGTISLSLTVIVSNSVSFFTAILLETFHKKKQFSYNFFIGMTLMVFGLSLCSYNNTSEVTHEALTH